MTLQDDGKIVVAGQASQTFAVARYTADGALDASFGQHGVVVTAMDSSHSDAAANAIALQSDGKIVAAGYVGTSDFAIARYNPNGTLDRSFSGDGIAHSDFDNGNDTAYAVAIQKDDRIVVAGKVYSRDPLAPDDFDMGVERLHARRHARH